MPNPSATVEIKGQSADILRALKETQSEVGKLEGQIEKLRNKSAQQNSESVQFIDQQIGKWISIQGATELATRALQSYMQASRQLNEDQARAKFTQDDLERRFFNQASLFDTAGQGRARQSLRAIESRVGSTSGTALKVAEAAGSSGFKTSDIIAPGGVTEIMLQALAATNSQGADAGALTTAASQFLAGSGQEINSANLKDLVQSVVGLKSTKLRFQDLPLVAKEAAAIKQAGNLGPRDILALNALAMETADPSSAATNTRNTITRLAAMNPATTKFLKQRGFDPSSFDFVGEDVTGGLDAFANSLGKLSQQEQSQVMLKAFGREALGGAQFMLNSRGRIKELTAAAGDHGEFEQSVALMTSGAAAESRRIDADLDNAEADRFTMSFEDQRKRLRTSLLNKGASPGEMTLKEWSLSRGQELSGLEEFGPMGATIRLLKQFLPSGPQEMVIVDDRRPDNRPSGPPLSAAGR